MTPLERAKARLAAAGNVTPAGQPITARTEGGGLAIPDGPVQPDHRDRDVKPENVTVTVTPTPADEVRAAVIRIDQALLAAHHEPGAPLPRTPATTAAEQNLDRVYAQLSAGHIPRDELTVAVERYEGAWLAAIRASRRP